MKITKRLYYFISIITASFLISTLCIFIYCEAVNLSLYKQAFKFTPDLEYFTEKNSIASYYDEKENAYYFYYKAGRVSIYNPDINTLLIKSYYNDYTFHYKDGILIFIYYYAPKFGTTDMELVTRKVTESDIKKYGSFIHHP